jgi:hypothetical protein
MRCADVGAAMSVEVAIMLPARDEFYCVTARLSLHVPLNHAVVLVFGVVLKLLTFKAKQKRYIFIFKPVP